MAIDFKYTWPPGELAACSGSYDLRTNDQRRDARMEDHQARIAMLEQRLLDVELLLHRIANDAESSADGVS